jgi:Bardet-Biedl syndrome 1 protein
LEIPIAMCVVFMENALPRIPSIAVAAGSYIFIYRQLRPYKKWACPPMVVSDLETTTWQDLKDGNCSSGQATKILNDARENNVKLTYRSLEFLSLDATGAREDFIETYKDAPLTQVTLITCMETLRKDSETDSSGLCLLVVGTESGDIYVLPQDPNLSQFLCKVNLPSVPVLMNVSGAFDLEWRISVTCRDGKLYSVKNGDIRGTAVLSGAVNDLGSIPISLAVHENKTVWIAAMNQTLSCFAIRGKKTRQILLNEDIAEICIADFKRTKLTNMLLVALVSGEIRLYQENIVVDTFKVEPPVTAMRFGPYGREDNCFVLIHGKSGCITVKIWKRLAEISANSIGAPIEQVCDCL